MPATLRLRDFSVTDQRLARMEDVSAEIRRALGAHVPSIAASVWTEPQVLRHARSPMDRAALAGSRVRASARSTTLTAATSPRIPAPWWSVEFGDGRQTTETYSRRSPGGGFHQVTRNTQAQLPARNNRGRVVYRYMDPAVKRILSAYSQTIARTLHDAAEGK
ncbi:hypothetical protein [Cellulosimicrobium cellulans]|uniref:hypothetical protein n=1 Tax=Cellulosimicrobium cellulans TaxID=1710 RepID=UPI001BA9EDAA|nr:hypothetical protein [Cellulosimicrobium cellulans]QUC01102.1 hypothetical protein J5A69_08010 [Cellulosimicrobium cellulans]